MACCFGGSTFGLGIARPRMVSREKLTWAIVVTSLILGTSVFFCVVYKKCREAHTMARRREVLIEYVKNIDEDNN